MGALALAVAVEMYVIVVLVTDRHWIAFAAGTVSLITFASLWFVGPWLARPVDTRSTRNV